MSLKLITLTKSTATDLNNLPSNNQPDVGRFGYEGDNDDSALALLVGQGKNKEPARFSSDEELSNRSFETTKSINALNGYYVGEKKIIDSDGNLVNAPDASNGAIKTDAVLTLPETAIAGQTIEAIITAPSGVFSGLSISEAKLYRADDSEIGDFALIVSRGTSGNLTFTLPEDLSDGEVFEVKAVLKDEAGNVFAPVFASTTISENSPPNIDNVVISGDYPLPNTLSNGSSGAISLSGATDSDGDAITYEAETTHPSLISLVAIGASVTYTVIATPDVDTQVSVSLYAKDSNGVRTLIGTTQHTVKSSTGLSLSLLRKQESIGTFLKRANFIADVGNAVIVAVSTVGEDDSAFSNFLLLDKTSDNFSYNRLKTSPALIKMDTSYGSSRRFFDSIKVGEKTFLFSASYNEDARRTSESVYYFTRWGSITEINENGDLMSDYQTEYMNPVLRNDSIMNGFPRTLYNPTFIAIPNKTGSNFLFLSTEFKASPSYLFDNNQRSYHMYNPLNAYTLDSASAITKKGYLFYTNAIIDYQFYFDLNNYFSGQSSKGVLFKIYGGCAVSDNEYYLFTNKNKLQKLTLNENSTSISQSTLHLPHWLDLSDTNTKYFAIRHDGQFLYILEDGKVHKIPDANLYNADLMNNTALNNQGETIVVNSLPVKPVYDGLAGYTRHTDRVSPIQNFKWTGTLAHISSKNGVIYSYDDDLNLISQINIDGGKYGYAMHLNEQTGQLLTLEGSVNAAATIGVYNAS